MRSVVPKLCSADPLQYLPLGFCCLGNMGSLGSSDMDESNIPGGSFLTRCITLSLELCLLLRLSPPVITGMVTFAALCKAVLAWRPVKWNGVGCRMRRSLFWPRADAWGCSKCSTSFVSPSLGNMVFGKNLNTARTRCMLSPWGHIEMQMEMK